MTGPRSRRFDDRGVVETVIAMPVLMLLLAVVVQAAVFFHARGVATTAARQGLDRARVLDGSVQDGQTAAQQFLAEARGGLRNPTVVVERTAEHATVTITSEVMWLTPGPRPDITVTVSAPVERVVD
jgi:Flp pilus assembly protein TadG